MNSNFNINISNEKIDEYRALGYNEDLLPKPKEDRTWNTFNYFTLWMGSVHNVPNYVAVGGFLFLGLSPINVMIALVLSSLITASILVLNGMAGSKYGIPFSVLLKASYGEKGAQLPSFLRGGIAAIMWYGLQTYAGSQALLILIGKIWPSFLHLGEGISLIGLSFPGLIAFTIFWIANLAIGLGGGSILTKFTAILNPLIYVVFGGMTIWAIKMAGGMSNILNFSPNGASNNPTLLVYLMIISSVTTVWAAPAVSVSDLTRNSKSDKAQVVGQSSGLLLSYLLFAFSSVCILIGATIFYGVETWNVLDIVSRWDNLFSSGFAILVLLMTTISTNATGNIIPAGYQLASIFPNKINYKKGVILASIISFIIAPWKLMENQDSIYAFLEIIGALISPISGIMISHYFVVAKRNLNLNKLYGKKDVTSLYPRGINLYAFVITIVAATVPFIGNIVPSLDFLSNLSWIIGFVIAFVAYSFFSKMFSNYE